MIARLRGRVDRTGEDQAIIDVGGVGYLVFCSGRTLAQLPGVGEATVLEIETHVREDHIHLYGFVEMAECEWFRTLTKVQGVGAKVALAILTVLEPDQLLQAVAGQIRDIESLLTEAFPNRSDVVWRREGKRYRLDLSLPDGRRQMLFVETSDHSTAERLLLIYSVCCETQAEYYEEALR